jgi:hypothetical protein
MSGIAEGATPGPEDSGQGWWFWFSTWYPIASPLILGPTCLLAGWNWLCFLVTGVGVAVVLIRHPWDYNDKLKLPLVLWNLAEVVFALNLILYDLLMWLKANPPEPPNESEMLP